MPPANGRIASSVGLRAPWSLLIKRITHAHIESRPAAIPVPSDGKHRIHDLGSCDGCLETATSS